MRAEKIARLKDRPFDVLVIGGGIAGAGIALEAARVGARTALVEARDFASGTSSRSSKLVHGGLRYLAQGKFGLTRESVRERNALLRDAPDLVTPREFLVPVRAGAKNGRMKIGLALAVYDFFAGARSRRWRGAQDLLSEVPIAPDNLEGGWSYADAETDDARLVLRVLQEAHGHGAIAVNYLAVEDLLRGAAGVEGARLRDAETGATFEVAARLVVNAAGVWSDRLRETVGAAPKLRPLRGSHLLFAADRIPLSQALGFFAQGDGRPIFAVPWEGAVLVGTTDVDHHADLDDEPRISREEFDYLLTSAQREFPTLGLRETDIVSTWAGVRPVVASGAHVDPSRETRDHLIVEEGGLLTVTGGKLTTFRSTAVVALRKAAARVPALARASETSRVFASVAQHLEGAPPDVARRLIARYGAGAADVTKAAHPGDFETIGPTRTVWAELRWAFRAEDVLHLEDAMLRRTRLGLLMRNGAEEILERVGAIAHAEAGWNDTRWRLETQRYRALIARCYSLPADA